MVTTISGYPYRRTPINNVTPFTYRDGTTYLETLEQLRSYVNTDLIEQLNTSLTEKGVQLDGTLETLAQHISDNEQSVKQAFAESMQTFDNIVSDINNRVGPPPVQFVTLNGATPISINPEWPTSQPVNFTVTQNASGNGSITFPSNVRGNVGVNPSPLSQTSFTLIPTGAGEWFAYQPYSAVPGGITDEVSSELLGNPNSALYSSVRDIATDKNTVNIGDYLGKYANTSRDIAAAIDAAAADPLVSTVIFPPREYDTTTRIRLRGNLRYRAHGATFRKTDAAAGYAVFYTGSDGKTGYASGDSGIVWEGGTFLGDFNNNSIICAFALHHTDDMTIDNIRVEQAVGKGHVIDMGGCSNITIENSTFKGMVNFAGGSAASECIQIDISGAGASSAVDLPGSWDGLPCENVTVQNCKFLPVKVGSVVYPAPNPFGNHAIHEDRYHKNIKFLDNYVLDAVVDTSSTWRGSLHFIGVEGLIISRNTFEYSAPTSHHAISLFATNQGAAFEGADYELGATNPTVEIRPLICRNVKITENTFKGFANVGGAGPIRIEPYLAVGADYSEDIKILTNTFETLSSGTSATNTIFLEYVKDIVIDGGNKFTGPSRAVDGKYLDGFTFGSNIVEDARVNALAINNSKGIKINGTTFKDVRECSYFIQNSENVQIMNTKQSSVAEGPVGKITNTTTLQVVGNQITARAGQDGMSIYGSTRNGALVGNIITGGTTNHILVNASVTGVSETANVKA